jgi:3-keto-5-aminohexanoate cleavage enzyme
VIAEIPIGVVAEQIPVYGIDVTWPVHLEPKVPTMNKKLIINVAPTGALVTRGQNPTQPYTREEIAKEVIESYREGASMFHVHCRDEGRFCCEPNEYKRTMDLVFQEAPDIVTNLCTVTSMTYEGVEHRMKPMVAPLLKFGKKYAEIAVINPVSMAIGQMVMVATPRGIQEETEYLESLGVKPEIVGYHLPAMETIQHYLLDTGIAKKPYFIAIPGGVHNSTPLTPDPEGYVNLLQMVRALPADCVWEAGFGGRNWLPLTVMAIMLGADVIRVGKEDTVHVYPHKDDIIESCAALVRKVATIAKALGRDIATPDEARKILGITL